MRAASFGDTVRLCSIVAGRLGGCSEDCKWCAQSAAGAPAAAPAKRAALAEILAAARRAAAQGASSFGIVNSGRRPTRRDIAEVVRACRRIRDELGPDLRICASLGELTAEKAAQLADAGIGRYNHNLETSRRFYPAVVTTHGYADRLDALAAAREAGMRLCCGGIFGLGESWADRVDLALTLREEVRPDVVPLNFLHPIPGTPLQGARPPGPMEILTVIAVFRMLLPAVDLKVAGGREVNLRDMQSWMFYAGATSCVIGNYLTTRGRRPADDLQMIADLGLRIVKELPAPSAPATV